MASRVRTRSRLSVSSSWVMRRIREGGRIGSRATVVGLLKLGNEALVLCMPLQRGRGVFGRIDNYFFFSLDLGVGFGGRWVVRWDEGMCA